MDTTLADVRRLEDEFAEAMTHMYSVGNGLARLRSQLEREIAPATLREPLPTDRVIPVTSSPTIDPATHRPTAPPLGHLQPSPAPIRPHQPWWQSEGLVSKVLAVAGSAVTLIGVAFLVTLAIQAGIFGPAARVASGAVLAAALLGAGVVVHRRQSSANGALVLAATGFAAAYLDIIAVTTVYEWVPPAFGLALAGAVAAVGLVLARAWDSQLLGVIAVLGVAALGPVVGQGTTLLTGAFLLVLTIATYPAQLGRRWFALESARTLPTSLYALLVGAFAAPLTADLDRATVLAVVLSAFVLTTTVAGQRHQPLAPPVAALALPASLPALIVATHHDFGTATILLALLGFAHLAGAWFARSTSSTRPGVPAASLGAREVLLAIGTLALLLAATRGERADLTGIVLLAMGAGYLGVAATTRSRIVAIAGAVLVAAGAATVLDQTLPGVLRRYEAAELGGYDVIGLALLVVVAVLLGRALEPHLSDPDVRRMAGTATWIAAFFAASALVVATSVRLSQWWDDPMGGFVAGHALATLAWMGVAVWLLATGLQRSADATLALRLGLVLATLSVAKLLLFDLSTLGGLFRVLSFIGAGILLLTMGALYARALERSRRGAVDNSTGSLPEIPSVRHTGPTGTP
ncbi:DUF2339 domain-containing protein [Janibacter sp. G1551]|uniref:DUF2339 domain-containing protein n=1 Tax=Janibacter sp. G1551 TaxID=3420440 RepID=UPI003D06D128